MHARVPAEVSMHARPCDTQVLQHEIRKTNAKMQAVEWMDELLLMEIAGKGGFGIVYKGTWKGSVAAIKVGLV